METDDEMFGKMEELDIANAIKNKDVPYVIAQIKGLIGESKASERVAFGKAILDLLKQMEEEPHALIFIITSIFVIVLPGIIVAIKYDAIDSFALYSALAIGFLVSFIISLSFSTSFYSTSTQQQISMQVFYPNHPNITVTQTCAPIKTFASGYFNGQAINAESTTQCNLPANIAPYNSNPYNCDITEKNITCVSSIYNENITWEGTILKTDLR